MEEKPDPNLNNNQKLLIDLIQKGMLTIDDIKLEKTKLKEMHQSLNDPLEKPLKKTKPNKKPEKPNNQDFLNFDDLLMTSTSNQFTTPTKPVEQSIEPVESILDKIQKKNEFLGNGGFGMSGILNIGEDGAGGSTMTLEQAFGKRLVPVIKEGEDIDEIRRREQEGGEGDGEELDLEGLDMMLEERGLLGAEESKGGMDVEEVANEIDDDIENIEESPKRPTKKQEIIDIEEVVDIKGMMDIETSHIASPSPEPQLSAPTNFQALKNSIKLYHQTLKPDFTKKYKVNITQTIDEDGDAQSGVKFYWYDMGLSFSDPSKKYVLDVLHIFGKVKAQNTKSKEQNEEYISACITIKNIDQTVLICKRKGADQRRFEAEVNKKLQKVPFKKEISLRKITKKYTFELDLPKGEVECLELRYPYKYGPLKIPFSGLYYKGIFGEKINPLESCLLEKGMKGPGWLMVKEYKEVNSDNSESWCKVNLEVENLDDFDTLEEQEEEEAAPDMKAVYVSLQTGYANNPKYAEIRAISLLQTTHSISGGAGDSKMSPIYLLVDPVGEYKRDKGKLKNLREKFGLSHVSQLVVCNSEQQLLKMFLQKLSLIDPDMFISHDLKSSFFDILIDRLNFRKISLLDKISRLKRDKEVMFYWAKKYGEAKYRHFTYGRLALDSFTFITDFWQKEKEYSLLHLIKKYQNPNLQLPNGLESRGSDTQILDSLFTKSVLSFLLAKSLKLVDFSLQLSLLTGCLWDTSLNGTKSSRNEMLILHNFYEHDYIIPDKYPYSVGQKKKKDMKKNSYQGGLVIEPKRGLYDKYVLMLDFNSLYPSIIREFKICFTTVKNRDKVKIGFYLNRDNYKQDYTPIDEIENSHNPSEIDEAKNPSISLLPKIVKNLVEKRKEVKKMMKNTKDGQLRDVLDIKQQAYKVISNSIYGCLGSPFSRFYSKNLAELVTFYGRRMLEKSAVLIEQLGFRIIYGDTDSVFVDTNTLDLKESLEIGLKVKDKINEFSESGILEIGIDAVYKTLLLNDKKRYAGRVVKNFEEIIVKGKSASPIYGVEVKGMDIVRREWCELSKEISKKVLDLVLSEDEDFRDKIYEVLKEYGEILNNREKLREIQLEKFLIHKKLNKSLDVYKSKTLDFVNVARKMKELKRLRDNQLVGKVISFVICKGEQNDTPAYNRAYSLEEFHDSFKEGQVSLEIDPIWYLQAQVIRPVQRILENVKGIKEDKVVELLGVAKLHFNHVYENDENVKGNQNIGKKWKKGKKKIWYENNKVQNSGEGSLSFFYDNYSRGYKTLQWYQEDKKVKGSTVRNFLNFGNLDSGAINSLTKIELVNAFEKLISLITQSYYESIGTTCEVCDHLNEGFSMIEEENKKCEECESELFNNLPAKKFNGNLYYLEQVMNKAMKSVFVKPELKEVIKSRILKRLKEVRKGSRYQMLSLESVFKRWPKQKSLVEKQYNVVNCLLVKKSGAGLEK